MNVKADLKAVKTTVSEDLSMQKTQRALGWRDEVFDKNNNAID